MIVRNYNASDVIRKNRNRVVYSNFLQQQKLVENGFQIRVNYVTGSGGAIVNSQSDVNAYREGVYELTVAERDAVLANVNIPVSIPSSAPAPAPGPISNGGSIFFDGTAASNLSIANDIDFRLGTGNFTIEWFQYVLAGGGTAGRIFSIGTYTELAPNNISIAVSLEGSDASKIFYAWLSSPNAIETSNYLNTWNHFAIVRNGTSLRIYKNGTQIGSTLTVSTDFNNSINALRIGNETVTSEIAAFRGYITNFRWTKGEAIYTSNFTRPSAPLTAGANTKLLLRATTSGTVATDSSGLGKTVTNTGVTWNALTPF